MVFRNGGIVKQTERWLYQGEEIEIVSIYKYLGLYFTPKIVNEYDQEIPQSQTADNPVAPRGIAAKPSRDTRTPN